MPVHSGGAGRGDRVSYWRGDLRSAEQGPRLQGCDRGADQWARMCRSLLRVCGVRSPTGSWGPSSALRRAPFRGIDSKASAARADSQLI